MKQIVTSYINPDLDGTASMYAYAEFLNKTGKESSYYIAGIPQREVKIVCDMFNIDLKGEKEIADDDKAVIVDTNRLDTITSIKLENIIEVIDHHPESNDIKKLKEATVQIELLGAVATLIAEKFKESEIPISRNAAILLYYGIISNSVNFKAKTTTEKDREIAKWLSTKCEEINPEKIKEIFTLKSQIQGDLEKEIEVKIPFNYQDRRITIGQLEIAEVDTFLNKYETKLEEILAKVKKEENIDMIFINCIDILNGYSTFVAFDNETKKEITKLFQIKFQKNRAKLKEIIMRKEIFKLMKASY